MPEEIRGLTGMRGLAALSYYLFENQLVDFGHRITEVPDVEL